ncbi:MAG: FecR domain-containing protein [Elusimicrobia bacterium]|nr:FecR domain-containing protein [Elusimicrobiota bacterium]
MTASLAVLLSACVCVSPVRAEEPDGSGPADARIVSAEGEVFLFQHDSPDEGAPIEGADAQPLEAGDRIQTGADGRVEIGIEGDGILELGPKSEFTVKALEPAAPSFLLSLGTFFAKLKHMSRGHRLSIHTPTAVAAVRGTEFGVDVAAEEGRTRVAVFDEGSVSVASQDGEGETMLEPNRETEVRRGEPPRAGAKLKHFLRHRQRMVHLRGRLPGLRAGWRRLEPGQRMRIRQQMRERLQNMPPERQQQLRDRLKQMHERRQRGLERRDDMRDKRGDRRQNGRDRRGGRRDRRERRGP